MDGLPVHALPERSAFVVGEGVEEGFAERDVRVRVLPVRFEVVVVVGVGRGVGARFGAVVVVVTVTVVMAVGASGVLRCGRGRGGGWRSWAFEGEWFAAAEGVWVGVRVLWG